MSGGQEAEPPLGPATSLRREEIAVPGPRDLLLLVVALSAVSTAGPLIAVTAAPPLAIAFWRNFLAAALLVPATLARTRAELRSLGRRGWLLCLLAGAFLAAHFGTWIPSISLTSVASATALVSTQPVWAALLARLAGRRVGVAAWLGIVISVLGAGLLAGADLSLSGRALSGDALALVGGLCGAAYLAAGSVVRARTSTTTYTAVCYGSCAALLLLACGLGRQQLVGYDAETWLKLVALAGGAQLLGHSLFNVLLRSTSPTVLSMAILLEVPGAALIAAVWLEQVPTAAAVLGLALLLAGIAVVVGTAGRAVPVE